MFNQSTPASLPPAAIGDQELAGLIRQHNPATGQLSVLVVSANSVRSAHFDANPHSVYELGSVTKAFTGLMIAEAIRRGAVSLDDTIGGLLPTTQGSPVESATLRELVTHTSGLPRFAPGVPSSGRLVDRSLRGKNPYGYPLDRLLFSARRLTARRGQDPAYSNVGTALAGHAVARAMNSTYEECLRKLVLDPVGLGSTKIQSRPMVPPGVNDSGKPQEPRVMDAYAPAGGLVTTPADMATLALKLLDDAVPGLKALDPITDYNSELRIGIFWLTARRPLFDCVMHRGSTGGYAAFFGLERTAGVAVCVLSRAGSHVDELATQVLMETLSAKSST